MQALNIRRIEAGILDCGSDFSIYDNPYEVGLGNFIDLKKKFFIGKDKLVNLPKHKLLFGFISTAIIPKRGFIMHDDKKRSVGIVTTRTGTDLQGFKVEEGKQDGSTHLNGEFDFLLEDGHVQRFSTATGGNYFPNFKVSSTKSLSSIMDVGDAVSVMLMVASSSHYCTTGIKIDDSTSNLDIDWTGGAAPAAPTASASLAINQ